MMLFILLSEQTKGSKSRRVFVSKKAKSVLKRYLQSDLSVIQHTYLFQTQKSKRFNTNALTQLVKRLYEELVLLEQVRTVEDAHSLLNSLQVA